MAQVIEIRSNSGDKIGTITFEENPSHLHVERTAAGFRLHMPIKLSFILVPVDAPMPMLSNLRGTIIAGDTSGPKMEVGQLFNDAWFTSSRTSPHSPSGVYEREERLTWQGSLVELAVFERIREGRAPQLEINLHGELCYLVNGNHPFYGVRTEPERFFSHHGTVRVTYSKEVWNKMLSSLGVAENVLVEIPLPSNPSGDWDPVWRALIDSRNYFEQGGETGWKGCVASVRLALEKWRAIEVEDPGPGFVRPSVPDREARTKKQRLDQLRWDLLQMAHQGPHTHAEHWTRNDALLMLSTLSALLAKREP